MDHEAIYNAIRRYCCTKLVCSQGAFDADGNNVEIDQALVDAARSELMFKTLGKACGLSANHCWQKLITSLLQTTLCLQI